MKALLTRLEPVIAAAAVALAVLGVTVSVLTTPLYVRTMTGLVGSSARTGLSERGTEDMAEAVRRFVTDGDAPGLPASVEGRPAFDEAAVAHLVDVRDVIVPARTITLVLVVTLAVWVVMRLRTTPGRRSVRRAATLAAMALATAVLLAALVGATDFGVLFTRFHELFFAEGTWVFPQDALLIRVFPLPFWGWSAVVWGGLIGLCATALWAFGRRSRFTEGTYGV
ncbi:lipoprotein intramolecular transacylase Lit [Anaerosoma tenue]|uniref:lipoprotein intramolecular transacylase Lit n=1 Tax=Anaerosoma tenue TaxID=2933588 RepID=UPI002260884B|nr:DUF1461 domain-containing protein [Anaerosoma tenue]MCK8115146.1 DUF1461 domain-containing protein [Anaerosoma tenue]